MKTVGLMLVKRDSKRLPNKNTLDFHGKPMFVVNLEKCLKIFDEVYVSSDCNDILKVAEDRGAIAIKRPKELCGDVPNIPVYRHAMNSMDCDAFVAVQANSPGIKPKTIATMKEFLEEGYNEVMTGHDDGSIYGSAWGLTKDKLKRYGNFYKPKPDLIYYDGSVDIHTLEDYNKALNE